MMSAQLSIKSLKKFVPTPKKKESSLPQRIPHVVAHPDDPSIHIRRPSSQVSSRVSSISSIATVTGFNQNSQKRPHNHTTQKKGQEKEGSSKNPEQRQKNENRPKKDGRESESHAPKQATPRIHTVQKLGSGSRSHTPKNKVNNPPRSGICSGSHTSKHTHTHKVNSLHKSGPSSESHTKRKVNENPVVSKKSSTLKRRESHRIRKTHSQKSTSNLVTPPPGKFGTSIEDLKSIYSLKTDEEIIKTLNKKLERRLDLTALADTFVAHPSSSSSEEFHHVHYRIPEKSSEEEEHGQEEEEDESSGEEEEEEEPEVDDYEERRKKLIEKYLSTLLEYKFQQRKNCFLQDKLYNICNRKGTISDKDEVKAKRRKVRKKHPHSASGSHHGSKHVVPHTPTHSHTTFLSSLDSDLKAASVDREHLDHPEMDAELTRRIHERKVRKMTSNYEKVVRNISQTMKSKLDTANTAVLHSAKLDKERKEKEEICLKFFDTFMTEIRVNSSTAVHTNTGQPMDNGATEEYITEMCKLIDKLRNTTEQFYKAWHGLNYSLKNLEEIETEGGELYMLEYEQLCGENESLKEKVEYRDQELEKAKTKISHCVQVLAHFKETEKHMNNALSYGSTQYRMVNTKIRQLTEFMDSMAVMYSILMDEQKILSGESNLFENVKLMRDFEKTNYQILQLRQTKHDTFQENHQQQVEIRELRSTIKKVKGKHPTFQKRMDEEEVRMAVVKANQLQEETRKEKVKQFRIHKLLQLLERRTIEPWKLVREQYVTPQSNLYSNRNCYKLSVQHLVVQ